MSKYPHFVKPPEPKQMLTPQFLRDAIDKSRWPSLTAFCRENNLAYSTIYKYLRGDTTDLRQFTRFKLAGALPRHWRTFEFGCSWIGGDFRAAVLAETGVQLKRKRKPRGKRSR